DAVLARSSVVANRKMNRERRLAGPNGYARDLGLHPLEFLRARHAGPALWTDLCCGTGRALIDAARELSNGEPGVGATRIEGWDLVGHFDPNPFPEVLRLHEGPVEAWTPRSPSALITCVHGLHYVGDKLAILGKATSNLERGGLFVGNLDLRS